MITSLLLPGVFLAVVAGEKTIPERAAPLRQIEVRQTFSVKDFDDKADGSRNEIPAILRAIAKARESSQPAEIVFSPERYVLDPGQESSCCLILKGLKNLVLDGKGAEIVIRKPTAGFVRLLDCENVIFKNFSIDYDPLPFTQGTVVGISRAEKAVKVRLDAGFPSLSEEYFRDSKKMWGFIKDRETPGRQKPATPPVIQVQGLRRDAGSDFLIEVGAAALPYFEAGDRYVQGVSASPICTVNRCRNVTFDGMKIYTGPGPCYVGSDDSAINLLNCKTLIKSGRWQANTRDGVIFANHRIGPWIEGCTFEGQGDDGINLHAHSMSVKKLLGRQTIVLSGCGWKNHLEQFLKPEAETGDMLQFLDPVKGDLLGEAKILRLDRLGSGELQVNLDRPLPDMRTGTGEGDVMVFNDNLACPNFVIRDNVFRFSRRYGVLCQAHDGVIENNRFDSTSDSAIAVTDEPYLSCGPTPRNVVIRGNTFKTCFLADPKGKTGAVVLVELRRIDKGRVESQAIAHIRIEENTFENCGRAEAIAVHNAHDTNVDNNHIIKK